MKYEEAASTIKKFKSELEVMKKQAQPGDTLPAEVFFMFMDTLVPAFDGLVKEIITLREKEDVSK